MEHILNLLESRKVRFAAYAVLALCVAGVLTALAVGSGNLHWQEQTAVVTHEGTAPVPGHPDEAMTHIVMPAGSVTLPLPRSWHKGHKLQVWVQLQHRWVLPTPQNASPWPGVAAIALAVVAAVVLAVCLLWLRRKRQRRKRLQKVAETSRRIAQQ